MLFLDHELDGFLSFRYHSEALIKDVRDRTIRPTDFFKVQCAIIQAILSRKLMKKNTVTDEKIFHVYKAFDRKK